MTQDPLTLLRQLKTVAPDPDYTERSRNAVLLATPFERPAMRDQGFGLRGALGQILGGRMALATEITAFLLVVVAIAVYYSARPASDLVARASELNASIQVRLNEVTYLLQSAATSSDTETIQKASVLLNKAAAALSEAHYDVDKNDLRASVDDIKVSEETLHQIEIMVKK